MGLLRVPIFWFWDWTFRTQDIWWTPWSALRDEKTEKGQIWSGLPTTFTTIAMLLESNSQQSVCPGNNTISIHSSLLKQYQSLLFICVLHILPLMFIWLVFVTKMCWVFHCLAKVCFNDRHAQSFLVQNMHIEISLPFMANLMTEFKILSSCSSQQGGKSEECTVIVNIWQNTSVIIIRCLLFEGKQ